MCHRKTAITNQMFTSILFENGECRIEICWTMCKYNVHMFIFPNLFIQYFCDLNKGISPWHLYFNDRCISMTVVSQWSLCFYDRCISMTVVSQQWPLKLNDSCISMTVVSQFTSENSCSNSLVLCCIFGALISSILFCSMQQRISATM